MPKRPPTTYGVTVRDDLKQEGEDAFVLLYGQQKGFNGLIPDPSFVPGPEQTAADAPMIPSGETPEQFVNRCFAEHFTEVVIAARHRKAQNAARAQVEGTALDGVAPGSAV